MFCYESACCAAAGPLEARASTHRGGVDPSPSVSFAGYSVPHPHESRMNLRVQAKDKTAVQALRDGLDTLMSVCEHVEDVFEAQVPVLPAHAGGQMEEEGDDGE